MLNKIYEFTLDLENNTYIPSMEFYKNDTDTSRIEITLKNDYQTLNLEGFTIVCKILKADDLELQNIVDIVDKDNGLIAINLSSQALASIGTNTVQLSIYEGLKRLSSKEFTYTVKDTLIDEEGIVSQNEYTLLTQLISSVQNIEDIINTSEITRVANEGTRIDNEATREVQEQARQSLKGQMDSLKVALDSLKTSMEVLKADVETSESTRELNETDRELLKAGMETLKSTLEALEVSLSTNETNRGLTFNSKIDAIDNKIIDVEARSVAKENLIDNKIVEVENRTLVKETLVDNKIVEANAIIANVNIAKTNTEVATNNANTKITETEATRQSIIATINNLVAQFNALAPASSTNVEVQLARTDITGKTHVSLQERLLADNKQQNILYSSVEGTYIASDSVDGYAKNVVIEGNTYQNPLNLAEIKSTGTKLSDGRYEIPLLTVGKNLISSDKVVLGAINDDGTDRIATSTRVEYVKVKSNTIYILSRNGVSRNSNIFYYDKDKKLINKDSVVKATFTTPSNCMYVRFFFGTSLEDNMQLEEGTTATTYESYQSHKLTILSDYQIEKVGVADRIVQLSDGKWYIEKNVGAYTLNGSENYILNSTDTNTYRISLNSDISASLTQNAVTLNVLSTLFSSKNQTDLSSQDLEGISSKQTDKGIMFRVLKTKLAGVTNTDIQNFIKANNILIKYGLTAPTYIALPDDQQIALRTFNNKTNILSLCEIEPTIKCDVPKSVGASIGAITNHLDNVDLELEKIKKLEDATNSTVIVDKDFVNISQTSNGYLSDVKLEGRTLNQLVTNGNFVNTTGWIGGGATLSAINNTLSLTSSGLNTYPYVYKDTNGICSSGKKVFVKATIRVTNSNCSSIKVMIGATVSGANKDIMTITNPVQNQYYTVYAIHSITDLVGNIRLYVQNTYVDTATSTGKVMEVQNVMALDLTSLGMTNYSADEINSMLGGYFEGLKSVGQDVNKIVVSSVKGDGNLFDGELIKGVVSATTGGVTVQSGASITTKNKIKVNPNSMLKIKNIGQRGFRPGLNLAICYYDKIGSFVSKVSAYIENSFNIPLNVYYIRLQVADIDLATTYDISYYDMILHKDGVAVTDKSYETDEKEISYLDTVDSTWKKPVLRGKWENGLVEFGDKIEKLSNGAYKYYANTIEKTLVGTETYVLNDSSFANTLWFTYARPSDAKPTDTLSRERLLCNIFNTVPGKGDYEGMFIHVDNIYIGISKTKCSDLNTFKTWLTNNNITFIVEGIASKIYECTPMDVASFDSETNYYLESGVLSPRSTIKVQNYIGEIINNLKEKVSIQENQNSLMRITLLNHEARLILGGH